MNDAPSTPYQSSSIVQIALDLRADREERVAVDVVQQVHAEQDRQREVGAADGGKDAGIGGRGYRGRQNGTRAS